MKLNLIGLLALVLISCSPLAGPRNIDWKEEWDENSDNLKALVKEIKVNGLKKYKPGNNNFPDHFEYPFDEGFYINYDKAAQPIDTNSISIRFYIDRGLLDHYSAFIYITDSLEIEKLESKMKNGGNDYKLEENWYIVND